MEQITEQEYKALQEETYASVKEYLGNLIPGMNNVIAELTGDMKEDTWEYLRMILDGFNWVVEAFNGIVDFIDPEHTKFDIAQIDASVLKLSDAYKARKAEDIAVILRDEIIPFLAKLQ